MTDTRATRANRRASERAHTEPGTAPTRGRRGRPRTTERAGTGPRVEEPESEEHREGDQRDDEDLSERRGDAESSHPSRRQSVSTREQREPAPHTALLMAQELLRYRPSAEAHDQWLDRLHHLVDIATTRPAPSRSIVPSGPAGTAAPGAPPPPPGPPPAAAQRAPSHASSPHDCQIVQRTAPDARVGMERRRDLQNRLVEELGQAGQQNRRALQGGTATYATGCMAFTRALRRVVWPQKFRPALPKGFDGSTNPLEFLQLYTTSIQAAGGDDKVMAN